MLDLVLFILPEKSGSLVVVRLITWVKTPQTMAKLSY